MTTIRIRHGHKTRLVELASRLALAKGSHCSMTEALDLLLDYCERHYTAKQLAELLMDDESANI